ncbi:S-locus lectin protein kinase family protein [Dorcoceras hygrometricum]|uniref:S-locus lectin protein kinase family protein n=1 Tax=Dorcoceras hygrometricum TaxID=472368 RepID=A0A2Z7BQT8_9LAMI|nr:S-locus lectin protein kinase family protein [Dorcoceras hygrometricum]
METKNDIESECFFNSSSSYLYPLSPTVIKISRRIFCENPKIQLPEIEPKKTQLLVGQLSFWSINSDPAQSTQILLSQLRFWTISSQLRSVQSAVSSQQSAEICIVISQQSVVNTDSVQSAVNSAMTGQLSFGRSTQL